MSSGLHGYLVIDKPAGWTSHDVVGRLRRILGERKIGHAGTLDPAATGVLPIAVGHATKTLEFLEGASKSYLAEITFGVDTDSFDGDGRVVRTQPAGEGIGLAVEAALAGFIGPQQQLPPMHSAIKIGGKRLYEAARRGEEIERPTRSVVFHELALCTWDPPVATVFVDCSKGTYVRSLAHDLGQAVGPGAYLSDLVRLRSGPFELADSWTVPDLQRMSESDPNAIRENWPSIAVHPDVGIETLPALLLDDARAARWQQGTSLEAGTPDPSQVDDGALRTYDALGRWLGVGRTDRESGLWRPVKVVAPPAGDADSRVEG